MNLVTVIFLRSYYVVTIFKSILSTGSHLQGGLQYLNEKDFQPKPLLTKREREVFELLVQDKTTREIASELFISEKTVRNHISNAMQKLGVKGRSQAVVELLRMGELKL